MKLADKIYLTLLMLLTGWMVGVATVTMFPSGFKVYNYIWEEAELHHRKTGEYKYEMVIETTVVSDTTFTSKQ